jgi:hypothetical protein
LSVRWLIALKNKSLKRSHGDFAVLRIDYAKTSLLDLPPSPDAPECFAQAKALLKDGWPSIRIGYDKLPPRFPSGYPAVMLPCAEDSAGGTFHFCAL